MPKVYENSDNVAQFSHRHCAGEAGRWVWASRGVGGEIESIDQGRRDHARFHNRKIFIDQSQDLAIPLSNVVIPEKLLVAINRDCCDFLHD